jgi:hypothetical protein
LFIFSFQIEGNRSRVFLIYACWKPLKTWATKIAKFSNLKRNQVWWSFTLIYFIVFPQNNLLRFFSGRIRKIWFKKVRKIRDLWICLLWKKSWSQFPRLFFSFAILGNCRLIWLV